MIERVPIGDFTTEVSRPVNMEAGVLYKSVGVKWYGEGVHVHEIREGNSFEAARFQIETEDIIYNDMWARMGSVAIVPPNLSGAVASSHFPTFRVDLSKALPSYLSWYFKSPSFWGDCEDASRGSTGRNQIKRRTFLAIKVPLPPLDEQVRVVKRVEGLAAKINESKSLREAAVKQTQLLPQAILASDPTGRRIKVREFARLRPTDVFVNPTTEYHFAGVYSFGRGVFVGQRKLGSGFSYPRLTRLRAGNFVYPKLMAWEGALGVVPSECDGLVVSTEFPVFDIDESMVRREVLDTYFRSSSVWSTLSRQSGGTNVRRRRLNPEDFLDLEIPWPQASIQTAIREAVERISPIARLQSETFAELDAMMPAILDKAFKGEL